MLTCLQLLQHHSPPQRYCQEVYLSGFYSLNGIWSLLCGFCLSAAGNLIRSHSGHHLTNLQPKLCKSIQLDVSAAQATVKLQTGHGSSKSPRSSSTDREGLGWRTDERGNVTIGCFSPLTFTAGHETAGKEQSFYWWLNTSKRKCEHVNSSIS